MQCIPASCSLLSGLTSISHDPCISSYLTDLYRWDLKQNAQTEPSDAKQLLGSIGWKIVPMGCVRWRLNKHTLLSTHKQIELIHCCCCFRVTPPLHGSLATFSQETSSVLITLHCDKQNPRLHLTLHYCINAHVRLPCVSKFQSDLTWLTVQSILTYHYFFAA